jgi:hypothetical protein
MFEVRFGFERFGFERFGFEWFGVRAVRGSSGSAA